jgi:hypothetical protein
MIYYYSRVNSVALPAYEVATETGTGGSLLADLRLAGGGGYDALGNGRAARDLAPITLRAEEVSADAEALLAAYRSLAALQGSRAKLYRTALATGAEEWLWVRVGSVKIDESPRHIGYMVVTMTFEPQAPGYWYGAEEVEVETTGLADTGADDMLTLFVEGDAGGPMDVGVTNEGLLPSTTPVITLTAGTGVISAWTLTNHTTGHVLSWSGILNPGEALEVHCGASSVKKDGADAYDANFIRPANKANWFEIAGGSNSLTLAVTSTAPASDTFAIRFYPVQP